MSTYMALLVGGPKDGELRAQSGYRQSIEFSTVSETPAMLIAMEPGEPIRVRTDCYWHTPLGGGEYVLIYRHQTIGDHEVLERMARYYNPPKKERQ